MAKIHATSFTALHEDITAHKKLFKPNRIEMCNICAKLEDRSTFTGKSRVFAYFKTSREVMTIAIFYLKCRTKSVFNVIV